MAWQAQDTTAQIVDAAVIGGSFAGLTAALYLARGRRQVVVIDAGQPRNHVAEAGHGLFGHDGRPPADMRADGLRDLLAYPEARLVEGRVTTALRGDDGVFRLTLADGGQIAARRLVLAYGLRDLLPEVEGMAQIWGHTAFQCPYCHGYELTDRPAGLLMAAPGVAEHARFLRQWVPALTVFTNGAALTPEDADALADAVEPMPLTRIEAEGGRLRALHLADGRRIPCEVLYLALRAVPACDLADQLGCRMTEGMQGPVIEVDFMKATSQPGIFAAGDLARPVMGAAFAVADGAMAGVACHRSLILAD